MGLGNSEKKGWAERGGSRRKRYFMGKKTTLKNKKKSGWEVSTIKKVGKSKAAALNRGQGRKRKRGG